MRLNPLDGLLYMAMRLVKLLDRRETPLSRFDPEAVRKILVVSSRGIGDALFATPGIRALRERYPHARIIGHFRDRYVKLFADNPHLNGIIPYYRGYRRFLRTIRAFRREGFDLAVIFDGNGPQAIPMAYLSGARYVVRIPNTGGYRFLLSNPEEAPEYRPLPFEHAIETRLRLAGMVGAASKHPRMVLLVPESEQRAMAEHLVAFGVSQENLLVGFQIGASAPYKAWPAERFAELGRRLLAVNERIVLVLLGSLKERSICVGVARAIGGGRRVLDLSGRLTLRELRALLSFLDLLVAPDTGPLHMAIAIGIRTLSLFASTRSEGVRPLQDQERHRLIQKEGLPHDHIKKKRRRSRAPMLAITVEEVFREAVSILQKIAVGAEE